MKEYKIQYTNSAQRDLDKMYYYFNLQLNMPDIGAGKIELIQKFINKLSTFPNIHPVVSREPWISIGARQFEIIGYDVIYEVDEINAIVYIDRIVPRNYVASHIEKDLDYPMMMGAINFSSVREYLNKR